MNLVRRMSVGILLICSPLIAGLRDPFPEGISMASVGTIMWQNGISGRQAWVPAAYYHDTLRLGFNATGTWYYDPMDNLSSTSIRQVTAGCWVHKPPVTLKLSYSLFDAMSLYHEQTGFFSGSITFRDHLRVGIDGKGYCSGLRQAGTLYSVAGLGASVWVTFKFASVSLRISDFVIVASGSEGLDPPIRATLGIHTVRNRYGALGALLEVQNPAEPELRIGVGEEYRLLPSLGLIAGLVTNPFMISLGAVVDLPHWGAYGSALLHPVLGWSKGVGFDYSR